MKVSSLTVLILLAAVSLSSCSKGKSTAKPTPPGTPAPSAPQSPSEPSVRALDIGASEVSPNGCLDLQKMAGLMREFQGDVIFRRYTDSFKMSPAAADGKPLSRFRNMAAEAALSSFDFEEIKSADVITGFAATVQEGCSQIDFVDATGEHEVYTILEGSTPVLLKLKSVEGGQERTVELSGPRELRTSNSSSRIDRCPDFQRAAATATTVHHWGLRAELATIPVTVSIDYMKQISVAVTKMPVSLGESLSTATGTTVQASVADLRSLSHSTLDPRIAKCPFHAKPPSADEAPPPEEEPSPTPTPAPTPPIDPGPTPLPVR